MLEILRHDGPGRIARVKLKSATVETPNLVFYTIDEVFSPPQQAQLVITYGHELTPMFTGKAKIFPLISPLISSLTESVEYGISLGADLLIAPSPKLAGPREMVASLLCETLESLKKIKDMANAPVFAPIYYLPYRSLRKSFLLELKKLNFTFYVIRGLEEALRNPKDLIVFLKEIDSLIGPNALLYASGRIPPSYYTHLIYLGIDLFDTSFIIHATLKNLYYFNGSWLPLEIINNLPCFCEACLCISKNYPLSKSERLRLLFYHNATSALSVLRRVSLLIRQGRLREEVESACHSLPELAALLRISDRAAQQLLEKYTPVSGKSKVYCIGPESYYRPLIERFRRRVATRYIPPKGATVVLLLPCSARKPYSSSLSHRLFRKAVVESGVKTICEGIVTSPLGLVPRELEEVYPAAHYDVPVTGEWDHEEIQIAAECIASYLSKFPDECPIVAHLDGGYLKACKKASELSGREIIYTEIEGRPTSPASLSSLRSILARFAQHTQQKLERVKEVFKKTADYQFGVGAGDRLISQSTVAKTDRKGRKVLYQDHVPFAYISPSTGLVIPTLEGGKSLANFSHWVLFKDEAIRGSSLMVPGVEDADPQIRPGDIVFILNSSKELIGVGEAVLNGEEMVKLNHGVAVKLKHVKRWDKQ